jgi:hypothetical protein
MVKIIGTVLQQGEESFAVNEGEEPVAVNEGEEPVAVEELRLEHQLLLLLLPKWYLLGVSCQRKQKETQQLLDFLKLVLNIWKRRRNHRFLR